MKRASLAIIISVVFSCFSFVQTYAQSGGKLVVENPVFDFGTVTEGTIIQHNFQIENKGSGVLTISRVLAQCGCTASNVTKNEIATGEKGEIKVVFDTSNFKGDVEKTVTVYSSDPEKQITTLSLKGKIQAGVVITPERLMFGEVSPGSPISKSFTIETKEGSKIQILGAKSFSRYVDISEQKASANRKEFLVQLGSDLPVEEFRARVAVEVQGADGKMRSIDIPIFASVKGLVRFNPPVLSLGILEGKGLIQRKVKVLFSGNGQGVLKSINVSNSAVKARESRDERSGDIFLDVEVDPNKVTNDIKAAINVVLLDAEGKEASASLNVYGIMPPK
ncbi:MAG: DUF1573 domain-containing protein [SAR324 cluster bacterium]|uniref:DUF1573 domain-containing protein n=1 Tax=SAR324 cluster bacterium TaxID=2024889 RepID=A0A7X9FT76_9DELT|nr:DUF1573 domain-containing protein [SAR324 cluster bacterium]